MKRKTNFDRYLEEQLKDKAFSERFRKAGRAWDVAIQLAALREKAGLSQKELAKRLGTSQQQISRLESTSYEGHSLSMLRRVAETLGATVKVEIQYKQGSEPSLVAEKKDSYQVIRPKVSQKSRSEMSGPDLGERKGRRRE
jgi:transcriptional regulator with XRE-family HTH domain